jgi:hypothetical protein
MEDDRGAPLSGLVFRGGLIELERLDPARGSNMKKSPSKSAESPSELIDARIEGLGDWRGEMLSRLRALIKEAVPDVAEEWK